MCFFPSRRPSTIKISLFSILQLQLYFINFLYFTTLLFFFLSLQVTFLGNSTLSCLERLLTCASQGSYGTKHKTVIYGVIMGKKMARTKIQLHLHTQSSEQYLIPIDNVGCIKCWAVIYLNTVDLEAKDELKEWRPHVLYLGDL